MITKVVVPLDGSKLAERAVGPRCALAERSGAPLVLLTSRWDDEVDAPSTYLEQAAAKLEHARVETKIIHDRLAAAAILTETGEPGTHRVHGNAREEWDRRGAAGKCGRRGAAPVRVSRVVGWTRPRARVLAVGAVVHRGELLVTIDG